jgi:hypothetical protein
MVAQLLGISREARFSPGKHAAGDAEILMLTRAALERNGYQTALLAPESLSSRPPDVRVVFSMCQSPQALAVLRRWERQGVLVINSPAAVLSCYRLALVRTLCRTTLPFPRSVVVTLDETISTPQVGSLLPESTAGWWVKRGDVHAMQPDDVVFVQHAAACREQLIRLYRRGVHHAVVQEHIPGHEIKFYALRDHGVLHCLTPSSTATPVDDEQLHTLTMQAGTLIGLEVYGGDCILTPEGDLYLVDVNDWPSFRGCRPLAATCIAHYILSRAYERGLL